MSFDPAGLRASSPASSGRASPISRLPRQQIEDGTNPKDKVYRRYALAVDRALSSFDTVQQEWADYISFLNRLLKALQAHPPGYHGIPDSQTVATRLAQCLKASLPSGVHQKALEVYAFVFTIIGPSNLARDFHLYFPGLSSVLSFASLTVRPLLLSIIEDHVLKLDPSAIRPALKSIILCMLPGLEDETSEDFERVLHVLDKFREPSHLENEKGHKRAHSGVSATRDSFFWQCFFLAAITNPSRRQGALAYLVRHLPQFSTTRASNHEKAMETLTQSAQAALSPEPGLLIRFFASGLLDKQVLVQRGHLDLLVTHLPLDSSVLQYAVPSADLDLLTSAAVGVVARREMSLNRRLWIWFLGPEPKSDAEKTGVASQSDVVSPTVDLSQHHAAYFAKYGLRALTRSVLSVLERDTRSSAERVRPFRICLALMDRWEVGGLLIPHIFIPALKNAFDYSRSASKSDADEVLRSASNFFDGVESGLIWAKIIELASLTLEASSQPENERLYHIQLCAFILQRFNLREDEMINFHMPMAALFMLKCLNKVQDKATFGAVENVALETIEKIITTVLEQGSAQAAAKQTAKRSSLMHEGLEAADGEAIFQAIKIFYEEEQGTIENGTMPVPSHLINQQLLRQSIKLFIDSITMSSNAGVIDLSTRALCLCLQSSSSPAQVLSEVNLLGVLRSTLATQQTKLVEDESTFPVVCAIGAVVACIQNITARMTFLRISDLLAFQDALVKLIWRHLDPEIPKHHVEAVRSLWQAEAILPSKRGVEASITSLLSRSDSKSSNDEFTTHLSPCNHGRKFAVLWTHSIQDKGNTGERAQRGVPRRTSSTVVTNSLTVPTDPSTVLSRPLFILLDWLAEDGTDRAAFTTAWLQQLPSLTQVFDILIEHVKELKCVQPQENAKSRKSVSRRPTASPLVDRSECIYYMQHISRILQIASEHVWVILAGETAQSLESSVDEDANQIVLQGLVVQLCMRVLSVADFTNSQESKDERDLERIALDVVRLIIEGPFSAPLRDLELENELLAMLHRDLANLPPLLQTSFLHAITSALRLRSRQHSSASRISHQRKFSREVNPNASQTSLAKEPVKEPTPSRQSPPIGLIDCLKTGLSSSNGRIVLDEWVAFLREVLPVFSDTIYQNLIPLVECFCKQINDVFEDIRRMFQSSGISTSVAPEPTLISLMNGLEHVLAKAHDKLTSDESRKTATKTPEQPQGFFGNMTNMTQGLFAGDSAQQATRTATANSRLAVLLCFQDTLRCCFRIWTWGAYGHHNKNQDTTSAASFSYTSLRLRKRALKVLENLFAAESLECLETLAVLYCHPTSEEYQQSYVLELLNVLNGSRPKYTAPAILNTIYRRINTDTGRDTIPTSDLTATDLADFLIEYVKSIEDDAMDEIWADCVAFLKDVLNNPLDYSQILPLLLSFVALIAVKVDNTNFGEQRKMRKELGDLFLKLLTATFTALGPVGFLQDSISAPTAKTRNVSNGHLVPSSAKDFALTLASVVSKLPVILNDNERISVATSGISVNVIGPAIRAKAFPRNIDQSFLELLLQLTKVAQGTKGWKKDVADALNDPKFFSMPAELAQDYFAPILKQSGASDKERMPELLGRLAPPATAGIVFGVGATSARMETDRKTQLNLRRVALLIAVSDEDTFIDKLGAIEEKLFELLSATPTSSPSSIVRAEVFMALRALVLRTSPAHLNPFWPLINAELHTAMLSVLPDSPDAEKYNNASVLQACKLLDLLVTLDLDDFQLHEWLFITDTIDAVYRPTTATSHASALADEVAEALGAATIDDTQTRPSFGGGISSAASIQGKRRSFLEPLLAELEDVEASEVKLLARKDLATRILRPFFGQLSILAFEARYAMVDADEEGCQRALLKDLFEEAESV